MFNVGLDCSSPLTKRLSYGKSSKVLTLNLTWDECVLHNQNEKYINQEGVDELPSNIVQLTWENL